ncbi:YMGG-like glycine zipper-containing protein [uncultured Ruegeria sp.]|uniref:YMGG-like glycine zipper-containing protein n=1 Tax=uncultured Ruegeria sp. TaxID=259304 RepID=UPI002616B4F6|nr:YMGG-like glycine zipper-containing protein [uncultured Ruegeria sp.]
MKTRNLALCAPLLLVVACAESPVERSLVVDGPKTAAFAADRRHCTNLALNYDDGSAGNEALIGAAIGATFGALEDDLEGAIVGAAIGGALGGLEGSVDLEEEQRDVLIRCMQNRGHQVIG